MPGRVQPQACAASREATAGAAAPVKAPPGATAQEDEEVDDEAGPGLLSLLVPKLLGLDEDEEAEGAASGEPGDSEEYSEEEEYEAPQPRAAPRGLAGLFRPGQRGPGPDQVLDLSLLPPNAVLVNVYDVGDFEVVQKVNRIATIGDNVLIGGVFHAGIQVYEREWGYGFTEDDETGITFLPPRCNFQHTYRATVEMGVTQFSEEEVNAILGKMMLTWRGRDYDLIHRNCLDFANEFAQALGVGRIPGWIDRFGRTARNADRLSKHAMGGWQSSKKLAKNLSTDVDQAFRGLRTEVEEVGNWTMRQVAESTRNEVPKISETLGRWTSNFVQAATRAIGDAPESRERRQFEREGDRAIRGAIRTRGGVTGMASPPSVSSEARQRRKAGLKAIGHGSANSGQRAPAAHFGSLADDPFLVGGPATARTPAPSASATKAVWDEASGRPLPPPPQEQDKVRQAAEVAEAADAEAADAEAAREMAKAEEESAHLRAQQEEDRSRAAKEAEKAAAEEAARLEAEKAAAEEAARLEAEKAAAEEAARLDAEKKAAAEDKPEPAATADQPAAEGSSDGPVYTLEQLTDSRVWQKLDVKATERETYLSASAFQELFGMSKEEFAKLPKWKRDGAKKKHGIF